MTFCKKPDGSHVCVHAMDNKVHVIPASVFARISTGEMRLTDLEDWEPIIRKVIHEWLNNLEGSSAQYRSRYEFESSSYKPGGTAC